MSLQIPRKRTILALHRWLGITSAVFLLSLSITGLALNHTESLKLDQIQIKNSFILNRYGMASGASIQAYRINQSDTLTHLDGQLFYNAVPLTSGSQPLGIITSDPIAVIATDTQLIYLTADGELIETINSSQLPYSILTAVGTTIDDRPVLISADGNWTPDADWLQFARFQGAYSVSPLNTIELSPPTAAPCSNPFKVAASHSTACYSTCTPAACSAGVAAPQWTCPRSPSSFSSLQASAAGCANRAAPKTSQPSALKSQPSALSPPFNATQTIY